MERIATALDALGQIALELVDRDTAAVQPGADVLGQSIHADAGRQLFGNAVLQFGGQLALTGQHMLRRLLQIPDNANPGQHLEDVVSRVPLIPAEALAGAGHEIVVVVVPALTHGQKRQHRVIP